MEINSTTQFDKAYQSLNAMQRKAVDTIYGPLMVIAGPGTGKTQLLSTRVGQILKMTDMQPHNILCITFTNSGVAAMKKRLVELIGPQGHDIEVYTFHSFAEKITQRYKRTNELDTYEFHEDLDKKILIRSLLEKIDFNTPLKKGITSVDTTIKFLINFFNQIKKEKYDIHELLYQYEEEKATRIDDAEFRYKKKYKEFQAGDLRQAKWDEFCAKLDKHIQACHLFREYQVIIEEKKLIDFDDLILNAIRLLQENDDLRFDFMEQYQFIMIDEFQDTNGAQLELINELCVETDEPNIMVVGDEDQSIFRFQGANVFNIHNFHERYLAHYSTDEQLEKIIVLESNYRSTPFILEASRILIQNNTERITHIVEGKTINKRLVASNEKYKNSLETIDFIEVDYKDDISIPIALEIEQLVQKGVNFDQIAVLFPTNQNAIDFADYLKILDYPFELSKEENILNDSLILSYLQVFHLIQNFVKDKYIDKGDFSALLLHPWSKLSLEEISKFWTVYKETNPESILDYLKTYTSSEEIKRIYSILTDCIKAYSTLPSQRFFHYVLDSFGIKEWAIAQVNRLDSLQKIEVLDRFIQDYLLNHNSAKFSDILARLDDYIREEIVINYVKHIRSENSIQLMTFHKSKGLEFDYVFIYGAGRFSSSNLNSIYIPESVLAKKLVSEEEEKNSAEEEKRRLLYVAMTRAKAKLYMVDVLEEKKDGTSKNKFKSELPIVSHEFHLQTPDIQAIVLGKSYQINEADYLRFEAVNQTHLDIKDEKIFENQFIENRIQNFSLSHSSINTYLECPQKFFIEKIISIPSESSLAMSLGNFYHQVLEKYFNQYEAQKSLPSLDELLTIARQDVFTFKHFMTEFEFRDIQKAMETNLPILYEQYIKDFNCDNLVMEGGFEAQLGTAHINGKLDKWYRTGTEIFIADFKTGKLSNSKKNGKLKPYKEDSELDKSTATVDELYGGNHWRQAMMYFILAKAKFQIEEIREVKFVFIIPENNQIESVSFTPNDTDETYLKNLIIDVNSKIKAKKFDGCKKVDCSWCTKVYERQSASTAGL
jgi:DNA helicase II / ATP-dependent DNA helicase PcrA